MSNGWPSDHVEGPGSWEVKNFKPLRPAYIEEKSRYVRVPELKPREIKILKYIEEKGKASPSELSKFTDNNIRSARTSLYKLMKLGKIERVEIGVYSLA
jgi:predicted HTH transcriptional regulator